MYNLNTNIIDEVAMSGHFLSSGKKWAHIIHGALEAGSPAGTSQDLLLYLQGHFGNHIGTAPMSIMSSDVQMDQITCKQVISYKSDVGRLAQISLTIAGGVITAGTIIDPGSGYSNGVDEAIVYDFNHAGAGAVINLTFAGNVLTTVTVVNGGANYSALTYGTVPLPDQFPPNRYDYVYGSSDILAPLTEVGGVATDRQPSFNAFSVRMRSSFFGRNGRGAAHWPGVPEASTVNDNLTAGVITAAQGCATAMYATDMTINGGSALWHCQILSPQQMHRIPPYLTSGGTANLNYASKVTTATVNAAVGSMLRRKIRV